LTRTAIPGEPEDLPSAAKADVEHTPKIVIAMISSKEEAAMRDVGIPFLTPYLYSCKIMQEGTKTAGLTAARMKPSEKQRAQGSSNTKREMTETIIASLI